MKILISGAAGFIGKHLAEKLLREGTIVYSITRPSTDIKKLHKKIKNYTFTDNVDDLISFIEKEKFDGVIHLASLFLAQHKPEDIQSLLDSNLFLGTALLEASVKSNVPWFINTGTFWQHYKNKKYSPVNLYAATKQAFEIIAQYYIETTSINFVTIKLCDTFGSDDTRQKIFNLWAKIAKTGESIDMSLGKQSINISHIDNVVEGYLKMIRVLSKDKKRGLCGKSFIVTSSQVLSLRNLASLFTTVSGKALKINWGAKEYREREVMKPWDKGVIIPGWKEVTSLEEGIRKTLNSLHKKS